MNKLTLNALACKTAILCLIASVLSFAPVALQAQTLTLDKSADVTTVQSGNPITYTIEYGCSSLVGHCEGAILQEQLPEGVNPISIPPIIVNSEGSPTPISGSLDAATNTITWDFTGLAEGGLPAGESGIITFEVISLAGVLADGTPLLNTASFLSDNAGMPSSSTTTTVEATPQWTMSKAVTSGLIYADAPVTYQIDVCSEGGIGNLNLENVVIQDVLPDGAVFISATNGGVHDGGTPGTVNWNFPTLYVEDPCTVLEVVVEYPSSDLVNNDTGLATTIPKPQDVNLTADPVGEGPLALNANTAEPLNPPSYAMAVSKMASDNGILPLDEVNHFSLGIENQSTAPLDAFTLADMVPDQFSMTGIELDAFPTATETYTIEVALNGGTSFVWQTSVDATAAQAFDVTTIPGWDPATSYVSNFEVQFGRVPSGFAGDVRMLVTSAYDTATDPALDNAGNDVFLGTPYTNTATLNANRHLDGAPIAQQDASDDMCMVAKLARIDPEKTIAINYIDPPAGDVTIGNPYMPGSRVTYTIRIENDGADEVAANQTGSTAFFDLVNPIASDLLPDGMDYNAGSYRILSNGTPIAFDATGTNPTFELVNDFNGTGKTLLRWNFTGDFAPGEDLVLAFDATIDPAIPDETDLTNEYCVSATQNFLCDEEDCGETSTTDINDFFGTTADPNTLITGITEMCCKSVTITTAFPSAVMDPLKMVTSTGPYAPPGSDLEVLGLASSIIQYNIQLGNAHSANIELPDPIGYDLLPIELDFVPGSLVLINDETGVGFTDDGTNPTFTVVEDYAGTGRTLLTWEFTGEFPINKIVEYQFQTKLREGAGGDVTNEIIQKSDSQDFDCMTPIVDIYDFDGDGDFTEEFCVNATNNTITIETIASLSAVKLIRGANDTEYLALPDTASTNPNDIADFRVVVKNLGNVDLNNVVVIDIFPYLNDVGVQLNNTQRNSEWAPILASPVVVTAGTTLYYSMSEDPFREEIDPILSTAGNVNDWTTTVPADLSTVKSIKVEVPYTLMPADSIVIDIPMIAPVDGVPSGSTAWNSLARNADEVPAQEPNKVGVKLEYPDMALTKTLSPGQDRSVDAGSDVTFRLNLENQGAITATDIHVVDYIPTGLTLNDPDWSDDSATFPNQASIIVPGPLLPYSSTFVDITLSVDIAAMGDSLVNFAEIIQVSDKDGNTFNDFDSMADRNDTNEGTASDNVTDNSNADEDDHDPEGLKVFPCEVQKLFQDYICDNMGTPQDVSDDVYSFTLNPVGTSLGATYSVTGDVTLANVPYGSPQTIAGPFSVNDPARVITVTDDQTPSTCFIEDFTIFVPTCGDICPPKITLDVQILKN